MFSSILHDPDEKDSKEEFVFSEKGKCLPAPVRYGKHLFVICLFQKIVYNVFSERKAFL